MKSEVRGQRSEVRSRRPEVRDQKSGNTPNFHLSGEALGAKRDLPLVRRSLGGEAGSPIFFRRQSRGRRAFAIVAVIIVVAVLTIMSVAFMQSMRIDRLTARAYLNKVKADMLAQAAREVALSRIKDMQRVDVSADPVVNLATPLMIPAVEYDAGEEPVHMYLSRRSYTRDPSTGAISNFRYIRQPLFSTRFAEADYDDLTSPAINTDNYTIEDIDYDEDVVTRQVERDGDKWVNMNRFLATKPQGWVGLSDANGNSLSLPVNWIYVKDDDGKVVGRYAYWTDDESAKIDIRRAGNSRDSGLHLRENGFDLDEVALTHLNGVSTDHLAHRELQVANDTILQSYRPSWLRLDFGAQAPDIVEEDWQANLPYLTTYSFFDDRAPNGKRKLNLNAIVTDTTDPDEIKEQVAIIRDWIKDNLPEFGKRYYGDGSTVTIEDQEIYYLKIAANIRDYVDSDGIATVLFRHPTDWAPTGDPADPGNDFEAYSGTEPDPELGAEIPLSALQDTDLPLAVGKEAGPYLSEYCRLMKVIADDGADPAAVTLRPVHYVELYNPTGQAITYNDLVADPANPSPPFVRICNRAPWQGDDGSSAFTFRPVDIVIYLPTNFSIPAGGYAVLTTDSAPFVGEDQDLFNAIGNRYEISMGGSGGRSASAGQWKYINVGGQTNPGGGRGASGEDYQLTIDRHSNNRLRLQCGVLRGNGYGTNETRLLFGNDQGLLDLAVKVYEETNIYLGTGTRNPTFQNTNIAGNSTGTANNGGSGPRYSRADPRTNTEVTVVDANTKSVWIDGLGAYGNNLYDSSDSNPRVTLGSINHSTDFSEDSYQSALPDWSTETNWNHRVSNGPMQSLGQLTDIFDPARYDRTHRGGGRTLRIGQSDAPSNTSLNESDPSTDEQNWLGGRGSSDPTTSAYGRNAWLLTDLFRLDDEINSRLSINAFSRGHDSPALEALFHEFNFSATAEGGHSISAGKPVKTANGALEIGSVVNDIVQAGHLPLSAAELSTASLFNTGERLVGEAGDNIDSADLPMNVREELMRRTLNLVDSRTLAFTIYSVGQAGYFVGDTFKVEGTHWESTTLQMVPAYPEPYDETNPQEPVSWSIQIVNHEIL
jgi:type II secretory pathway pseudopilin PulG